MEPSSVVVDMDLLTAFLKAINLFCERLVPVLNRLLFRPRCTDIEHGLNNKPGVKSAFKIFLQLENFMGLNIVIQRDLQAWTLTLPRFCQVNQAESSEIFAVVISLKRSLQSHQMTNKFYMTRFIQDLTILSYAECYPTKIILLFPVLLFCGKHFLLRKNDTQNVKLLALTLSVFETFFFIAFEIFVNA